MRSILALTLLAIGIGPALGDDAKKPDDEKKPSLKVGDAPPPLHATKWLQGKPVESFEPGKVYVVEFWATWCGPCVAIMPHVAALQNEYRDKGVTVVGFTSKDPGNTAEKVNEFVGRRGPKLGYTIAFADNRDTYDAYMKAAGQNGIPCSYVVGKDGKLAYIGHPVFLDDVLPKVVAGTWDPEKGKAELDEADKEFDKVFALFGSADVEGALKAFSEFEAKRPKLANCCYFTVPRVKLLIKAKKFDEARAFAEKAISQAMETDDDYLLRPLSAVLREPAARSDKGLVMLAVKAAEAALHCVGDKDVGGLLGVAEAYLAAKDPAKAKAFGEKAIPIAKAAVEAQKNNSRALVQLAEAYFVAGNVEKAKETEKLALDAAPNDRMKRFVQQMIDAFDPPTKEG